VTEQLALLAPFNILLREGDMALFMTQKDLHLLEPFEFLNSAKDAIPSPRLLWHPSSGLG
jgi:hypothetical protein